MKQKSKIPVKMACKMVFAEVPDTFSAVHFCNRVKAKTWRNDLMDGTILRRLRELRTNSTDYNYRCIDSEKALYQKV